MTYLYPRTLYNVMSKANNMILDAALFAIVSVVTIIRLIFLGYVHDPCNDRILHMDLFIVYVVEITRLMMLLIFAVYLQLSAEFKKEIANEEVLRGMFFALLITCSAVNIAFGSTKAPAGCFNIDHHNWNTHARDVLCSGLNGECSIKSDADLGALLSNPDHLRNPSKHCHESLVTLLKRSNAAGNIVINPDIDHCLVWHADMSQLLFDIDIVAMESILLICVLILWMTTSYFASSTNANGNMKEKFDANNTQNLQPGRPTFFQSRKRHTYSRLEL